ncbi:site-2 protease family protein [Candidatus Azambacteria bacterium]|nr:site-2 protease family protein [Candidatus Azambacteria bacterium]MBI3685531.1 site-2 protease family protein [Candidatus Azambacteria bacterium]
MILFTIVIFVALLAALILLHEWGHFFVARKSGIRVDEFGIGFPPKAFSVKYGGTEYSVNWVPLGGFVKIHGEDGDVGAGDPDSFGAKPLWVRMGVILAGVGMNFLTAIVLLSFGFWYGLPQVVDENVPYAVRDVKVTVLQVAPNSPAEHAGIKIGDAVKQIRAGAVETAIEDTKTLQDTVAAHKGEEIVVVLTRGKEIMEKKITPRKETLEGQGPLGVVIDKTGIVSYPWYLAPVEGVKTTFSLGWLFLSTFGTVMWGLFTHGKMIADISGPVGIGALTYQVTQLGFSYVIQFAAIISLNLAIINALPIPALDGGRFLFLLIEGIKGSPVSQRYEKVAHAVGFMVLIALMIAVTVRDVMKLF